MSHQKYETNMGKIKFNHVTIVFGLYAIFTSGIRILTSFRKKVINKHFMTNVDIRQLSTFKKKYIFHNLIICGKQYAFSHYKNHRNQNFKH